MNQTMHSRFVRLCVVLAALAGPAVLTLRAEEPAAIQQRMASRLGEIDGLKLRGAVGEDNRGLLQARAELSPGEAALVAAENGDRGAVSAETARRTGASAEEVGRTRARRIAERASAGIWVQDSAGNWTRK